MEVIHEDKCYRLVGQRNSARSLTVIVERPSGEGFAQTDDIRMSHLLPGLHGSEGILVY